MLQHVTHRLPIDFRCPSTSIRFHLHRNWTCKETAKLVCNTNEILFNWIRITEMVAGGVDDFRQNVRLTRFLPVSFRTELYVEDLSLVKLPCFLMLAKVGWAGLLTADTSALGGTIWALRTPIRSFDCYPCKWHPVIVCGTGLCLLIVADCKERCWREGFYCWAAGGFELRWKTGSPDTERMGI